MRNFYENYGYFVGLGRSKPRDQKCDGSAVGFFQSREIDAERLASLVDARLANATNLGQVGKIDDARQLVVLQLATHLLRPRLGLFFSIRRNDLSPSVDDLV